jgi:hypothetical protein
MTSATGELRTTAWMTGALVVISIIGICIGLLLSAVILHLIQDALITGESKLLVASS